MSEGDSYKTEAAKQSSGGEPKYISAASVSSQITGDCQISGNFTEDEAKNTGQSDQLRFSASQDDRAFFQRCLSSSSAWMH
jgi:preprotein translocase subunit SecD